MANELTIVVKELDIIKSIQYFKLKREKELLERDKSTADNNVKDGTKWYNVITNTKNVINNKKSEKKSNQLEDIDSAISKFEKDNSEYHYNLWFDNTLSRYIDDLYKEDKYGLQKIMLGISIALDDSRNYLYEDEEYQDISKLLFGNLTKMNEIKKTLKENYVGIASKNLSNLQKGVLIGLGVGGLVLACTLPVMIAGGAAVSAATTTAGLAAIGFGDMQVGIGMAALFGLIGGTALVGAGYATIKASNIIDAKKAFRKLNCDEAALLLSVKALLISEAKKVMSKEDFKEYLSELLEAIDTLKSDTEYMLYVENKDINTNKDKIDIFYKWNKRLNKIFDL